MHVNLDGFRTFALVGTQSRRDIFKALILLYFPLTLAILAPTFHFGLAEATVIPDAEPRSITLWIGREEQTLRSRGKGTLQILLRMAP